MNPRPPELTRTDHLLPYPTLCRSGRGRGQVDSKSEGKAAAETYSPPQPGQARRSRTGAGRGRGGARGGVEGDTRTRGRAGPRAQGAGEESRSEGHTSELQSLMRNQYAVFWLNKKTRARPNVTHILENK